MSEPSLALQGALNTALRAASAVTALIETRVYDRVPKDPTFPYVSFGDMQVLPDQAECLEGSVEIYATIDVWSRTVGKVEAKTIAGAIVSLLHNSTALSPAGYRVVLIQHDSTHHLDDPDGLTSHSAVTFKALLDEA